MIDVFKSINKERKKNTHDFKNPILIRHDDEMIKIMEMMVILTVWLAIWESSKMAANRGLEFNNLKTKKQNTIIINFTGKNYSFYRKMCLKTEQICMIYKILQDILKSTWVPSTCHIWKLECIIITLTSYDIIMY